MQFYNIDPNISLDIQRHPHLEVLPNINIVWNFDIDIVLIWNQYIIFINIDLNINMIIIYYLLLY
jgi:hypothetical protein